MRSSSRMALVVGLSLAQACATGSASARSGAHEKILEEEVEATRAQTAYDLIVQLRPNFLASRGPTSIKLRSTPQADVYLDNVFYGDIRSLRTIPKADIAEVRFYPGYEAMQHFGSGHLGGVIQVVTKH